MNVKVFAVSAVFFFKGAEFTVDFGIADFKVFLPFCLNTGACFGIFSFVSFSAAVLSSEICDYESFGARLFFAESIILTAAVVRTKHTAVTTG